MRKIGVFVCHCGRNISGTVDIEKVVNAISAYPGVTYCTDYKYMCSAPGQDLIKNTIQEEQLDGIVIAACSPSLHEVTFRSTAEASGLNPYLIEIANIREQCSWVHTDRELATRKAITIIQMVIEKTKLNEALLPVNIKVNPRVLVIGGGIAGIQASLDIADSGHTVVLIERSPSIGGHMAQLSETFPTLDCSQCILTPKMVCLLRIRRDLWQCWQLSRKNQKKNLLC
jgi:heterodisulfide reductase subunit A